MGSEFNIEPLFLSDQEYIWVTTNRAPRITALCRVCTLVNGWVWVDRYYKWLRTDEYTLATPAEILKAKLLGE